MITDKDFNTISGDVYEVDALKEPNAPLVMGDPVGHGKFLIIEPTLDAPNGLQAMAVSPIVGYDDKGKPIADTSEIVIAFAGTNQSDIRDLQTDFFELGLGQAVVRKDIFSTLPIVSQMQTAVFFAEQIKAKYPTSHIDSTGHSLGGAISNYTALKTGLASHVFNAPDIGRMITEEEMAYMQAHPEQFRNYRHKYDNIGNVLGNPTKTAIYPEIYSGKDKLSQTTTYHSLSQWKFDKAGRLIDNHGKLVTPFYESAMTYFQSDQRRFQKRKQELSQHGYSRNEEIFLDSEQARMVSRGIVEAARAAEDQIRLTRDSAVSQAEELWKAIDFDSYTALSYDEVLAIFSECGVTYESIVTDTETTFDRYVEKSKAITSQFEEMDAQIEQSIQTMLETDRQLAEDFNTWKQM